jgi:hypothetical protein
MVNIGTLIIFCIVSLFIGFNLAWWKASKDLKHHLDDMKEFYRDNTRSFAEIILKRLDKYVKGGE